MRSGTREEPGQEWDYLFVHGNMSLLTCERRQEGERETGTCYLKSKLELNRTEILQIWNIILARKD